jgi:sigma-E factor negative regulatory protein RseA
MVQGDVMDNMNKQELVSALADAQLRGEAFARGVEQVSADAEAREAWATYHLIGDVLRSADLAGGTPPERFLARLQQSLAAEPLPLRPVLPPVNLEAVAPAAIERAAANDTGWRWKLVAGMASVTAMAAVAWNLAGGSGPAAQPQMATAPAVNNEIVANTERGTMLRDARLDQLMAAHRQFGSANALQTPAGFLRNATFEGSGR